MWLRLQLLPPLLPLLYAERAPDASKSLRAQLASGLLSLLVSNSITKRCSHTGASGAKIAHFM